MNRTERIRYGREVERINRKFEKLYYPKVVKALKSKARAVIARLRSGGTDAAMRYLHDDLANAQMGELVKGLYRTVGLRHANRVYADLRQQQREKGFWANLQLKRFGFNSEWIQAVQDLLERFGLEKLTFAVNETTRRLVMRVLVEGIEAGLSIDNMVKQLEEAPFLRYQAARIVRTEIKRASEAGASAAAKTFEYEQVKEWIAIKDNRVRGRKPEDHADHLHMDGQTVDEDGHFTDSRSGALLRFPGDPEAPAKDVINCRCTVAYVAKRDDNGRLIPKQTARRRVYVQMPGNNPNRQVVTI